MKTDRAILLDDYTKVAVQEFNWPAAHDDASFASEYRDHDPSLWAAVCDGRIEMGDHVQTLRDDMDFMVMRAREAIVLNQDHGECPRENQKLLKALRLLSKELRRFQ